MAEWLGSLTLNRMPLTVENSNSTRDFEFFHVSNVAYRMSVILLRCPLMPEIVHGGLPEVFLGEMEPQ